jgi:LmbE family N-acetylglucosaminyl deacetylase
MKTAIAIAAHPDDIELMMAGTLLLLKNAGYEIHYLNLSCGNLGTTKYDTANITKIRLEEAKKAAEILGAQFHPPFCNDLEIFYDDGSLRRLTSIIREVKPGVVLTHSPVDYMEDHTTTCRLAVTASFARGMTNYQALPERPAGTWDCTVYHALPHGLKDPLRKTVSAGAFVNTALVHEQKLEALKAHQSQQDWLDVSQKLNSYLQTMEDVSLKVGQMSGKFIHAEGWRRHLHFGFCNPGDDPLSELGEDYLINQEYEQKLDQF